MAYGKQVRRKSNRSEAKVSYQSAISQSGDDWFLEEFWDRIQREYGWNAPPSQWVSRDKNAHLSRSRIVG